MNPRKTTAILTTMFYLFSSVIARPLQAALEDGREARQLQHLSAPSLIPPAAGRITSERYFSGSKKVFLIQDLHCHPEVQRNIQRILSLLDERYGLATVYVEGAASAVDTSWLLKMDHRKKGETLSTLLSEGKLTGSEYFSVTANRPGLLRGIEDASLYDDNLRRLGRVLKKKEHFESILAAMRAELAGIESAYLGRENRRLARLLNDYRKGTIAAGRFYRLLVKYAGQANREEAAYIDPGSYSRLSGYLDLIRQGKQLRHRRIARELRTCAALLKEKLPYQAYQQLLERTGNFSHLDEFALSLSSLDAAYRLDLAAGFPQLALFLAYLENNRSVNPLELVKEEKELVRLLRAAFAETASEREVVSLTDLFGRFEEFMTARLSAEDYAEFSRDFARFAALWGKYAENNPLPGLAGDLRLLNAYYQANLERNECFIRNLPLTASSENREDIIVLVAGGFHTAGLERIFAGRGISYVTITPNVTEDTRFSDAAYAEFARRQASFLSQSLALKLLSTFGPRQRAGALLEAELIRQLEAHSDMTLRELAEMRIARLLGRAGDVSRIRKTVEAIRNAWNDVPGQEYGMITGLSCTPAEQGVCRIRFTVGGQPLDFEYRDGDVTLLLPAPKPAQSLSADDPGNLYLPEDDQCGGLIGKVFTDPSLRRAPEKGAFQVRDGKLATVGVPLYDRQGRKVNGLAIGPRIPGQEELKKEIRERAARAALSGKDRKAAGKIVAALDGIELAALPGNEHGILGVPAFNEKKIFLNPALASPVAVFHEAGEKILNRGDVPEGCDVHVFLRGAGTDARAACLSLAGADRLPTEELFAALERLMPRPLSPREKALIAHNRATGHAGSPLDGLQDKLFGRAENEAFTAHIAALLLPETAQAPADAAVAPAPVLRETPIEENELVIPFEGEETDDFKKTVVDIMMALSSRLPMSIGFVVAESAYHSLYLKFLGGMAIPLLGPGLSVAFAASLLWPVYQVLVQRERKIKAIEQKDPKQAQLLRALMKLGRSLKIDADALAIYKNGRFEERVTETFRELSLPDTAVGRYSVALAVSRLLKRSDLRTSDATLARATDIVCRLIADHWNRTVFGPATFVINFFSSEGMFRPDIREVTDFEEACGVRETDIVTIVPGGSKSRKPRFLDTIKKMPKDRDVTILFRGHGGRKNLYLRKVTPEDKEENEFAERHSQLTYRELAKALIKAHENGVDLSRVTIVNYSCYSYNYVVNLLNRLAAKGIRRMPLVISSANKNDLDYRSSFMAALKATAKEKSPLNVRGVLAAESRLRWQDLAVFFPLTEQTAGLTPMLAGLEDEKQNDLGKRLKQSAMKLSLNSHLIADLGTEVNSIEGFIGRLYDRDGAPVTGGVTAARKGRDIIFTGNGKRLTGRGGAPARVRMLGRYPAPAFAFDTAAIDSLAPGFGEYIEDFLAGPQVQVIEDNENIRGFNDGEYVYLCRSLLDDPIALFHELGEGYFAANPGRLPEGVGVHTYLRGCGKDARSAYRKVSQPRRLSSAQLLGLLQAEMPRPLTPGEKALVRHNIESGCSGSPLDGLQDRIFGPEANERLTVRLFARRPESTAAARPSGQLPDGRAIDTPANVPSINSGTLVREFLNPAHSAWDTVRTLNDGGRITRLKKNMPHLFGKTVFHVFRPGDAAARLNAARLSAPGIMNIGISLLERERGTEGLVLLGKIVAEVKGIPVRLKLWAQRDTSMPGAPAATLFLEPVSDRGLTGSSAAGLLLLLGTGARETISELNGNARLRAKLYRLYSGGQTFGTPGQHAVSPAPAVIMAYGDDVQLAHALASGIDPRKELLFNATVTACRPAMDAETVPLEDLRKQAREWGLGIVAAPADIVIDAPLSAPALLRTFEAAAAIRQAESVTRGCGVILRRRVASPAADPFPGGTGNDNIPSLLRELKMIRAIGGDALLLQDLFERHAPSLLKKEVIARDAASFAQAAGRHAPPQNGRWPASLGSAERTEQKAGYLQLAQVLTRAHDQGIKVYREFAVTDMERLDAAGAEAAGWLTGALAGAAFDGMRLDLSALEGDADRVQEWLLALRERVPQEALLMAQLPSSLENDGTLRQALKDAKIRVVSRRILEPGAPLRARDNECLELFLPENGQPDPQAYITRLQTLSADLVSVPLAALSPASRRGGRGIDIALARDILKILHLNLGETPAALYRFEREAAWNMDDARFARIVPQAWTRYKEVLRRAGRPDRFETREDAAIDEFLSAARSLAAADGMEGTAAAAVLTKYARQAEHGDLATKKTAAARLAGFVTGLAERHLLQDNLDRNRKNGFENRQRAQEFGRLLVQGELLLDTLTPQPVTDATAGRDLPAVVTLLLALGRYQEAGRTLAVLAGIVRRTLAAGFRGTGGSTAQEEINTALDFVRLVQTYYEKTSAGRKERADSPLTATCRSVVAALPADYRASGSDAMLRCYAARGALARLTGADEADASGIAHLLQQGGAGTAVAGACADALSLCGDFSYAQHRQLLEDLIGQAAAAIDRPGAPPLAFAELVRILDLYDGNRLDVPNGIRTHSLDPRAVLALLGAS